MNRKNILFLLTIILTTTLTPSVYAATMEGVIGSYDFTYTPSQGTPSKEYTFNVPYDGLLDLWTESNTQDWAPPLLYIETQNGWILYQSISIPIYNQGDSLHLRLQASTLDHQAGTLYYRLNYDDGENTTTPHLLTADFTVTPTKPTIDDTITVTDNSRVQGATITDYTWTIDGTQQPQYQDQTTLNLGTLTQGNHTIQLTITDSQTYTDTYTHTFTVAKQQYIILDRATCTQVQQTSPYDAVNRKTEFNPDENINVWLKLGNITGTHTIDLHWNSPTYQEIRHTTITIPDPTTQGYTQWTQYTVWDTIKTDTPEHTSIITQPGQWYVSAYIDGKSIPIYEYTINNTLDLTLTTTQTKLYTDDTTQLTGTLTLNNQPLQDQQIYLKIYRNQKHQNTITVTTDNQGQYQHTYTVPKVTLTQPPTQPETWKITAEYTNHDYGQTTTETTIQVLPIWLEIKDLHFVQIVEAPKLTDLGGTNTYIATDRTFTIRLNYKLYGLKNTQNYPPPTITYKLTYGTIYGSTSTTIQEPITIDPEKQYQDWTYTLGPGKHYFHIQLDPDKQQMNESTIGYTAYMKTHIEETLISKKMKDLNIIFIPIDMDIGPYNKNLALRKFTKKHQDFIKNVYPLPDDHFHFQTYLVNLPTLTKGPIFTRRLWLINELAYISVLEGGAKIAAVLPDSLDWWEPEVSGYSTYYLRFGTKYTDYFLPYNTRAVLIRYGANEGVTAHEIGHTLGLNRYKGYEEYEVHQFYGKQVQDLIEKDGKIYNITNTDELRKALVAVNGKPADRVFCFMGSNEAKQGQRNLATWVCDETYKDLFTYLKDPPEIPLLYVSGTIYQNDTISFNRWIETTGLPDPQDTGNYTVQCLSTTGEALYSMDFGAEGQEYLPFGILISYPEETHEIVFKHGETVIGTRKPSQNKPTVTTPQITTNGDTMSLTWNTDDLDEDPLETSILYSNNAGETWQVTALHITEDHYTLNTTNLPGGENCLIKLVVNDGFNTNTETSNPFTIEDKPPICHIEPVNQTQPNNNQTITLTGFAYDPEDGILPETQLSWTINTYGYMGTGAEINTTLTPGTNIITLTTTDSKGNQAQDTYTIQIQDTTTTPKLVYQTTCKNIDSYGNPITEKQTFNTNESIISLLKFTNTKAGDQITWDVTTPNDETETWYYDITDDGNNTMYISIDPQNYPNSNGDWTITINYNGQYITTQYITVEEPPTGLVWWTGIIGLVLLLTPVIIIIILILRFIKQRKSKTPKIKATTQQTPICPTCGNPATWIPQYNRWYCYNCEKYLQKHNS